MKGIYCARSLRGGAILLVGWVFGIAQEKQAEKQASQAQDAGHVGAVQIQMRNVNFRLAHDIALEVRTLRGELQKTKPEVPVMFDDPASFTVKIDAARVAILGASLTALMNSYVLAYDHAPTKNVTVTINGSRLIQKGTVHRGSVSPTEDGNIRVHADKIKSAHLPVKGLLHLFGKDLSKPVNQNAGRGMKVMGDDIILKPPTLTPPPHLEGPVTGVSIADGKIVQVFDSGRHPAPLTPVVRKKEIRS